MCGIVGIVSQDPGRPLAEMTRRMCDVLTHRGPDEGGLVEMERATLAMRRLSIIDVAHGHQPMHNEDRSLWIVFNGEIYNYQELQRTLAERGHQFYTQSDTEALVHAYEEYGDRCVDHLRGMFAFAIWDTRRARLFAARDRFGEKPFYYWPGPDILVFGSEIKAIVENPAVPRDLDPHALDEYLTYGYIPAPRTIFRGISKLPAAHTLVYENGAVRVQRYWRLEYQPEDRSEDSFVEELRDQLAEAVRIRLISEVPLGAFLSGGVDSSTIVAMMSRTSGAPVKTFSIGFAERKYDEVGFARQVAVRFATEHYEYQVTPQFLDVLPRIVWAFDEPFADSSAVPTYYVSQAARRHVTVALSGDGGDELFAGYPRYFQAIDELRYQRWPAFVRGAARATAGALPAGIRGKRRLRRVGLSPADRYLDLLSMFEPALKAAMYSRAWAAELRAAGPHDSYEPQRRVMRLPLDRSFLTAMQAADLDFYLPEDILMKVDKMSMLHSLETRAPLLDHRLAELLSRMPARLKYKDGTGKYLLKRAMTGVLPDSVLRRAKMGFGVPINHWFRRELYTYVADVLTSERFRSRGYFSDAGIQWLLRTHRQGRIDNASRLWTLLCFELWARQYLDRGPVPPAIPATWTGPAASMTPGHELQRVHP